MGKIKQAVVIIHGIGEQRPLDTLRGFTLSILTGNDPAVPVEYESKPDLVSESYELQRFRARTDGMDTDFYEFYWAHHMEGTQYLDILQWLRPLIFRSPGQISERIRYIWRLVWILPVLLGIAMFILYLMSLRLKPVLWIPVIGIIATVSFILVLIANFVVIRWVGDAARYINATPHNVARRQVIRAAGVRMLKRLHEQGDYDRIVVVGHSLGSMIAYDILRYAWLEYHQLHERQLTTNPLMEAGIAVKEEITITETELTKLELKTFRAIQPALDNLETAGLKVQQKEFSKEDLQNFRDRQAELWLEQRLNGNPWLVTDFVTLGSPLSYAPMLLATTEDSLNRLIGQREIPTCPPPAGDPAHPYSEPHEFSVRGGRGVVRVLHHAAVFACTRWTNLYFPRDLVGGPLSGVLGHGIRDKEINLPSLLRWIPLLPHTWYWRSTPLPLKPFREKNGIDELKQALELGGDFWRDALDDLRLNMIEKKISRPEKTEPVEAPTIAPSIP